MNWANLITLLILLAYPILLIWIVKRTVISAVWEIKQMDKKQDKEREEKAQ